MTTTQTAATAKREYKLAADPIPPRGHEPRRRELVQVTDDGHREVILVVPESCAFDVLETVRRAYQDGREDNAAMLDAEGRLITAPRTAYTHDADGAIIAVDARKNAPDHMRGDGRNMEMLTAEEHADWHRA